MSIFIESIQVKARFRFGKSDLRPKVAHKSFNFTSTFAMRINTYLSECSLGGADLVHHPKRDADHGGESEQPANDIAPPWIHILIVVL